MRLISPPHHSAVDGPTTNRTLLAGLAISMECFHLDTEDCTGGEFGQQFFREAEAGHLLPAMGDEQVDRSAVDEQVHVGALMVAERGVERGLQRVGQQEAGLGPGTSAVAGQGDP